MQFKPPPKLSDPMRIFWPLMWRAVVLLPLTFVYLLLLCAVWVICMIFPLIAIYCALNSDWSHALMFAAGWVAAFFALRWWRHRDFSGNYWGAL